MKKGFTLVELLVVIAIIGILSSVVFASLSSARGKARVAAAQQTMGSLNAGLQMCLNSDLATFNYPAGGDTNTGGAGAICTGGANFVALPTGWVFCDNTAGAQGAANCGNDISQYTVTSGVVSTYSYVAESDTDDIKITCTPSGCVKAADTD